MLRLLLLGSLAACGVESGLSIGGDLTLMVGGETVTPTVGAVIADADPEKVMIVIGTRDISCETTLESPLRKGTYVAIVIDPVAGTQPEAQVTVIRVASSGTLFNGAAGEVVIDEVGARIAGSLDFATQDQMDDVVTDLSAIGSFDVVNCMQ